MLAKNALIIDDSRTARAVLKHQLNQFDVVVESAPDGNHALEMLRDHTPDVIFLDHIMPGLDGFQVLQLLKVNQTTCDIPVVMYTSQAAPQYTSEAKSLGAVGVIPKKVTDEQLMQVLDKAELYHLKAVNADHHSPAESTEAESKRKSAAQAPGSPAPCIELRTPQPTVRPQSTPDQPAAVALDKGAAQAAATESRRPVYSETVSLRGWFVTALLILLIVGQAYGLMRDRHQQQVVIDLREQVQQQEQQLLKSQEQIASERRQLTEATWQQVQFVVDTLINQLEQERAGQKHAASLDEAPSADTQ